MAAAVASLIESPPSEQRMLLRNVSWKDYVLIRDVLDGPGIRMTYVGGALELMSPSPEHELWKTNIARLVELFAHLRRVELYGSTAPSHRGRGGSSAWRPRRSERSGVGSGPGLHRGADRPGPRRASPAPAVDLGRRGPGADRCRRGGPRQALTRMRAPRGGFTATTGCVVFRLW